MSSERIVRYTAEDLPPSRTDWERLRTMTEEEIEANARSDPDNPPWTDDELARAVPVKAGDLDRIMREWGARR
jgi:hypothetical protein